MWSPKTLAGESLLMMLRPDWGGSLTSKCHWATPAILPCPRATLTQDRFDNPDEDR